MPEKRDTFWLYKDLYERLSSMSDRDMGELFLAILAQANGDERNPQSPAAVLAWDFISFEMKRAEEYHQSIVERNRKNGEARWNKSQAMPSDAKQCQAMPNVCQGYAKNAEKEKEKEKENISKRNIKEKAFSYGEYGWVKLTQKEHERLIDDLGDDELEYCIKYVDMSAQKTNNKNHWKDWNLVIRSCSRGKWYKGKIDEKPVKEKSFDEWLMEG